LASLTRVFLWNKFMPIMLAITLAVAILFSSSLTLATIYMNDSIERALSRLTIHQLLAFMTDQNFSSTEELVSSVSSELDKIDVVEDYEPILYVSKWVLKKPLKLVVNEADNISITIPGDTTLFLVSMEHRSLKPIVYISDYLAYTLSSRNPDAIEKYKEYAMENPNHTVSILDRSFYTLFSVRYGYTGSSIVYGMEFTKLYGTSLNTILDELAGYGFSSKGYMALIGDYETIDYILGKMDELGAVRSPGIGGTYLISGFNKYLVTGEEAETLRFNAEHYIRVAHTVAIVPMKYDIKKLFYGYSISASIRSVSELIYKLSRSFGDRGYGLVVLNDYFLKAIEDIKYIEPFMRFTSIVTIVPGLIIIWVLASKTPPVVLSITRKIIALIRIRGIGIKRIKYSFLVALLLWSSAGLVIGLFSGVVYAVLLKGKPIEYVPRYIGSSIDIYSVLILLVMVGIALLLSIRKSFRVLKDIAPREFTRPTIFAELPLLEKGMGIGSWIALTLGIYYIAKTLMDFSPMMILQHSPPRETMVMIILIILAILDPFLLFLGPILFIYGVTKLLISYPDTLGKIIRAIVSPLVGELKNLVSNLIQVKPARLSLSIMMIGFAVGFLLMGLLGVGVTNNAFNTIKDVAYGTDYYVYREFNSIDDFLGNYSMLASEYSGYVGEHTVAVMVDLSRTYLYMDIDGHIRIDRIMFINGEEYTRIFHTPASISPYRDADRVLGSIGGGDVVVIAKPEYTVDFRGPCKIVYIGVGAGGEFIEIDHVNIMSRLYSIPGIIAYNALPSHPYMVEGVRATTASSQTIPMPNIPTTIVYGIDSLERVLRTLNNTIGAQKTVSYPEHEWKTVSGNVKIYYIVATNKVYDEKALTEKGWIVFDARPLKGLVDNAKDVFLIGINHEVTSGLALYTTSMIAIAILAYSSIYENLYAFTLLRARGVGGRKVFRIALSESLVVSLLGIIPGLIIGLLLGYCSPRAMFLMTTAPDLREAFIVFGADLTLSFTPEIVLPIVFVPGIVLILSLTISLLTYRRVLREAIMVLGSHI